MRVNNGSAVKSSSTTRKTRGGNYRFEISEDLLNAHPIGSSQEEDDQLSALSYDQVGRNVNDLRNGRSVTPTTPSLYSGRSSVQTRTSLHSEHNTRASTTMSTRSSMRRRETFSVANEPHPYGLESRGLITSTRVEEERQEENQSNNTNSSASSSSSESFFRRMISSVCKYVYLFIVGVFLLEKWCLHVKRKEEANHHQAEDQNIEYHRQVSSCSGGMNGGSVSGGVVGIGTVSGGIVDGGGVGSYVTSSEHEQHEYGNQGYIYSSTQRIIRTTRTFVTNMLNTSTGSNLENLTEDEDSLNERSLNHHHHHQRHEDNYSELDVREENSEIGLVASMKDCLGSFWELFMILLRLFLVILALYLLWNFRDNILISAGEVATKVAGGVGSALSVASSGLTTIISFLASLNFAMPRPAQFNQANPSSMKTDSGRSSSVANEPIIIQKDSEVTLAALKVTQQKLDAMKLEIAAMKINQETFEALKMKIASLEKILVDHEARFNAHDDSFKSLEMEIKKITSAMKAASAKEKSVQQIIDEVLSAKVGETTEGEAVSLKSMFIVLTEDRDRISKIFESELRALSENIGKVQVELNGNINNFNSDLRDINSRVTEVNTIVNEQKTQPEVEVDIEKLKTVLLPILSSEIQRSVEISCQTRNCPEGAPVPSSTVGEFSTADIELMIKRAIAKYDADKTGLPDLALESAGGSILSTRCTKSSELRNSVISYWGFRLWSPPNTPRTIIQPGVVPGECWAFEGSVGDVVIKLAVPSIVSGFTLEHIPKSVSRYGHIDSAPKHFQVLGLQSEHDVTEVHDYGSFTFDENDEPLQYFPVTNMTSRSYPIVELKILSNHGNMRHTCIYRFRVHGAIDIARSQQGSGGGGKTKSSSAEEESNNNSN